jgi:hypothetical protein
VRAVIRRVAAALPRSLRAEHDAQLYSHIVASGREKAVGTASDALRRATQPPGNGAAPKGILAPTAAELHRGRRREESAEGSTQRKPA